jgi:hypothetical protein
MWGEGGGGYRDQELGLLAASDSAAHGHGLSGGRCFVQQGGVRQLHGCQVRHDGLEIQQRLQPISDINANQHHVSATSVTWIGDMEAKMCQGPLTQEHESTSCVSDMDFSL